MSRAVPSKAHTRPRQRNPTDRILGCFANVEPSPTLDHLIRYLSTWSGTDKCLMLTQYSSKVIIALLQLQHSLRIRVALAAKRSGKTYRPSLDTGSTTAQRLAKLGSLISGARTLYRIWGILPIIKWMIALERTPPPTRLLHNIERIQGWSMLLYCPMEAIAYLGSVAVLPVSAGIQNALWLWSSRAWAVYVGLQLLHLVEDNRLLRLRARALERSRGHPVPLPSASRATSAVQKSQAAFAAPSQEKAAAASSGSEKGLTEEQVTTRKMWGELDDRKEAILNELVVNIGYMPLTMHWSHPTGLLSETWVGLFGTMAGIAGIRNGWKATAD